MASSRLSRPLMPQRTKSNTAAVSAANAPARASVLSRPSRSASGGIFTGGSLGLATWMLAATEVEDGERQLDAAVAERLGVAAEDRVLPRVFDPRAAGVDAQLLDPAGHAAALADQRDQLGIERVDAGAAVVDGGDVAGEDGGHGRLRVGWRVPEQTKTPRVTRGGR